MRAIVRVSLLLACAFALLSAARCYPPGTRVVVFIEGVYSAYDPEAGHTAYDSLKAAFIAAGYEPAALPRFSYAGGSFAADGAWQPAPYGGAVTDRSATENVAVIETMVREYRARHPDAHFTLVGHSLGGRLAFIAGARDAARPEGERLHIDAVVTLDAPLLGVSADKKIALDAIPCPKTYLAAAEIVAEKADPAIGFYRAAEVEAMRAAGIRVMTAGNPNDCLYALGLCTSSTVLADDSETQFLPNADVVVRYAIATDDPFHSHFAILDDPNAARDIVAFAGPP